MLHTINKSPTENFSLASCMNYAHAGSDILLYEDGVYGALNGSHLEPVIRKAMDRFQFWVLEPDIECRGLEKSRIISGIQFVDYKGFVELAIKNNSVQAWH